MVTTPPSLRPAASSTPSPTRLRTLDGLRFAAALGVVTYHYTARWSTVWGEEPGDRFPVLGHVATYFALAPELFFVLSGFVILWTAWGRTVPAVIASRLARIFPAYWAALALTSFLLLVVWREGKRISPAEVAVNVTLLQEPLSVRNVDGVYWTLWSELRFYVLVVVLVAIGLRRGRVLLFAAAWPVLAVTAHLAGWSLLSTVLIGPYAPFFAGGMVLYLIHRDGHALVPWLAVGLDVALALLEAVPAQTRALTNNTVFEPSPLLLAVVVVGCFGAVAVLTMTRLQHLDWRTLTALGALTYPLYLVHEFWGWWVIDVVQAKVPTLVALGTAVALSVVLAWVIHHGVEAPLNRPMRRWIEGRLSRLAPQPRLTATTAPSV
ncbi:MAG TPA: acyltransferase [Propionicimonas sp.]|uniref:acyltransferase family protein n=1 Tax=Propionicimonas sp. TaxID=1955623 RepID=UPI002F42E56A